MPGFRPGLDRQNIKTPDPGIAVLEEGGSLHRSGGIIMKAVLRDDGQDLYHPRPIHLTVNVLYENPKLG